MGAIRAKVSDSANLENKHVVFGSHGKLQFALWSQNGRDYLFVTPLPKVELEEIVRGARADQIKHPVQPMTLTNRSKSRDRHSKHLFNSWAAN